MNFTLFFLFSVSLFSFFVFGKTNLFCFKIIVELEGRAEAAEAAERRHPKTSWKTHAILVAGRRGLVTIRAYN